jgi:hypothetical protein
MILKGILQHIAVRLFVFIIWPFAAVLYWIVFVISPGYIDKIIVAKK